MASNITHYFSNKLNKIFENNIKLSFISNSFIIIITNEDKVYEFDKNAINNSLLVFSNNKSLIEKEMNDSYIQELYSKDIIEFIYITVIIQL